MYLLIPGPAGDRPHQELDDVQVGHGMEGGDGVAPRERGEIRIREVRICLREIRLGEAGVHVRLVLCVRDDRIGSGESWLDDGAPPPDTPLIRL